MTAQESNSSDLRSTSSVCGAIVTYNCGAGVATVAELILSQVGHLVIVDNGSDAETIQCIQKIRADHSDQVTEILHDENLGIAAALNHAALYARERDYQWLLTLDHDSSPDGNMVAAMLDAFAAMPGRESVAVLAPVSIDTATDEPFEVIRYNGPNIYPALPATYEAEFVHTSGNLVRTTVFEGGLLFRDDYFIDCVDIEFCLRLRNHGYRIVVVETACMRHTMGEQATYNFFGKPHVYGMHSATRQYYMVRNSISLFRETRNLRFFKAYSIHLIWQVTFALLGEPHKVRTLRAVVDGARDALRGKMGQRA